MRNKIYLLILLFGGLMLIAGCKSKQDNSQNPEVHTGTPSGTPQGHMGTQDMQNTKPNMEGPDEIEGVVEEEISLHELISNPENFKNKLVKITGKVIKVNPAIMNRNWVHVTAEPDDGNNYDLTITTQEQVEVNQVISMQGQISVDRDFGAGYRYDVIMENAKLIVK